MATRAKKHERKALLRSLLGDQCVSCGTTKRLCFDHVLPEDKSFDISQCIAYSLEKLLPELQKCQLLCVWCHAIKTRLDNGGSTPTHGTYTMYVKRGCRCDACRHTAVSYVMGRRRRLAYA